MECFRRLHTGILLGVGFRLSALWLLFFCTVLVRYSSTWHIPPLLSCNLQSGGGLSGRVFFKWVIRLVRGYGISTRRGGVQVVYGVIYNRGGGYGTWLGRGGISVGHLVILV